jgi:hypothetical protein
MPRLQQIPVPIIANRIFEEGGSRAVLKSVKESAEKTRTAVRCSLRSEQEERSMRHRMFTLVAALALGCAFSASAADKEAKPAKEEKKVEVKTETKAGGDSKFKRFWIHTVGGTIGNGLKKGANKIANTFD